MIFTLPDGFKAHDGKGIPVSPETYIEGIVYTAEGLGSTGVMKAGYHDWDWSNGNDPDLGDIVGYRISSRDEPPRLHRKARIQMEETNAG
jgi:hypothetical protein